MQRKHNRSFAAPSTVSVVLSFGVAGWAGRGMELMTSVLVSSPAWRGYDLLPALRRRREDAD